MKFSYFNPPISTKHPFHESSLAEVFSMITSDQNLRETTQRVRNGEANKVDVLPFITPSGLFKGRKLEDLVQYSGILCIDLDKLPDLFILEKLKIDTQFQPGLIFISPSGEGLKVFYRINNAVKEDHRLYFKAISLHLFKQYGVKSDEACKDIPRACFLCYAPAAFFSGAIIESSTLLQYLSDNCKTDEKMKPFEQQSELSTTIGYLKSSPDIHVRAVRDLQNAGWKNPSGNYWTRPGKEKGTSAEFKKVDGFYRFINYSSNGFPFGTETSYDDLDVITILEFNCDPKACIKALAQEKGLSASALSHIPNTMAPADAEDYFIDRDAAELLKAGSSGKEKHKICGVFLYENTITYLFSRTNYGKSLLVFQMAYAAATGTSLGYENCLINECKPMKTLVVDLEMEPQDLYERHGIALKNMDPKFAKNLHYLHEKPDNNMLFGLNLLQKIEDYIMKNRSKLVIIDNLSKLLPDSLKPEMVTLVISTIKRVKQRTGASFLVIGHTTKGNPKMAIQASDYFGSSMVQNFFSEVSYLDMTVDGKYFLCQTKTKKRENYQEYVPVFVRSETPDFGVGFNFEAMRYLEEIQLPLSLGIAEKPRKRSPKDFLTEINILDREKVPRNRIADMLDVSRSTLYRLLDKKCAPL